MKLLQAILSLIVLCEVSADFTVTVWHDGSYSVNINGDSWLNSAATFFQANHHLYTTGDGSLKMANEPEFSNGSDALGPWTGLQYTWNINKQKAVKTGVRKYKHVNAAIFSQSFMRSLNNTSVGDKNRVISGFPSFKVGASDSDLAWLQYADFFIGWMGMSSGRWKTTAKLQGGLLSGPLLLFDAVGNVLIISSFSQFMAASFAQDNSSESVSWGIMGDVNMVPANFEYETIVFYSSEGINKAMSEWGKLMRRWYERSTASRQLDLSINYISYYTDNGAYYYNFKEPRLNYEQTIEAVVKYAKQINIPYRSFQLDDWWYPIEGPGYGATITWTADPKVFPHGLEYIYNLTSLPVVAHNRYWSNITTYAKQNGGKYNFLMDGKLSLPDDQTFWDDLFYEAKKWGLAVYEQDWCNYQVENFKPLHSDVTLGQRWLQQMGEAAQRYSIQIQYCMALPRHLLAALEIPAVSQIRASIDYQLSDEQWKIGITSMFADAIGVAPFKDNLWTKSVQPKNKYNKTEPNPLLQVTVALLSTGPVGVGDRAGYSDPELINRLINADGLLLKPSKPATAIDYQIVQMAFGYQAGPVGEIWSTYSEISEIQFGIIFCPELLHKLLFIGPKMLGFQNQPAVVYSYKYDIHRSIPQQFDESHPLVFSNCTNQDFCLYYSSPVFKLRGLPVVLLGELSKLVPLSPQRTRSLEIATDDIQVTLAGKPGEDVTFYVRISTKNVPFKCVIGKTSRAVLSVVKEKCE